MAITITKNPAIVNFSRNPIAQGISTNNHLSSAGSIFEAKLYLQGSTNTGNGNSGAINVDEEIIISWNNKIITLVAKASPLSNGFQFPSGTGNFAHAQAIATSINLNKTIEADFIVIAENIGGDVYVRFTARKRGFYPAMSASEEDTIFVFTSEVDAALRPYFKIWRELQFAYRDDSSWTKILERSDDVDASGVTIVELQEQLASMLTFELPTSRETNISILKKSIGRFFYNCAEMFGTNGPELQTITWSGLFYVLRGGLSHRQFPGHGFYSHYIGNKFLSWYTGTTSVLENQPYYLTFLLQSPSITQVKIKVVTTYANGSVLERFLPALTVKQYDKILVPAGVNQLSIGSDAPTQQATSYTVALVTGAGAAVSEVRSFIIDQTVRKYARVFLFESSLGCAETICFFGKAKKEVDFSKDLVEVKIPHNYIASNPGTVEVSPKLETSYSVNSGFLLGKKTAEQITDFFLSSEKHVYDAGKRIFLPILVNTKTIKIWKDGDYIHSVNFEYTYKFNDHSWSNEQINLNPDDGDIGDISLANNAL